MITLELYKQGWNTKYLQYNPDKSYIDIIHNKGGIDIVEMEVSSGKWKSSYGYFDGIHIRDYPIPSYVPKSDILVLSS